MEFWVVYLFVWCVKMAVVETVADCRKGEKTERYATYNTKYMKIATKKLKIKELNEK